MNTSLIRRATVVAATVLAVTGVAAPLQASAHAKKTSVKVSSSVKSDGIVKVTWKYQGTAPKSQSLRVYGSQGALNFTSYALDRSTRSFTFSNLTPELHYRFQVVGSGPSVRGSVELTTPAKRLDGASPTPTPTTPGGSTTPTPTPTPSGSPATKPAAPTNLTATTTANSATLSWTAPADTAVVGYRVDMRMQSGSFFTFATTTATTYTINALFTGTTYEFRVATVSNAGVSDYTTPISVIPSNPAPTPSPTPTPTPSPTAGTPTQPAPVAPSGLAAVTNQSVAGSVRLSWTAPSSGATPTKYRLEEKTATGTSWRLVIDLPANYTMVDVTDLRAGETYQYRVSTLAGEVLSAPSAVLNYTVPAVAASAPSAVRSLQATVTGTTAMLSWTAPENTSGLSVTSHKLQMSADAVNWVNLSDGNAATAATLTGLESKRRYYFRVAAVTSAGVGTWSGPVSVQVP